MEEMKVYRYENGKVWRKIYYKDSQVHRENGPAVIEYNKKGIILSVEYVMYGCYHRIDGPAIIEFYALGDRKRELYYVNGKLHRLDGPALIQYNDEDGSIENQEYWVNGEVYKDQFQYLVVVGSL